MRILWKTEGITDLLALASLGLPNGHEARTNPFGADEDPNGLDAGGNPKNYLSDLQGFDACYVIHDCDEPGQAGATKIVESKSSTRLGWAPAIAKYIGDVRNVDLGFPITKSKGKDLRDWINERLMARLGFTSREDYERLRAPSDEETKARADIYQELLALAESMPRVPNPDPDGTMVLSVESSETGEEIPVLEGADDPHRLARLNLQLYRDGHGRDLKYWAAQWYRYKAGRYEQIPEDYLQARITQVVKAEFDRLWHEDTAAYEAKKLPPEYDERSDKGPPTVRKVTVPLVKNIIAITKSECVLSSTIQMPCWLEDRSQPHLLAMGNGLLDLDLLEQTAIKEGKRELAEIEARENGTWVEPEAVEEIEDDGSIMRDHSPNWFSTFCLDYSYVEDWDCVRWKAAINKAMQNDDGTVDQERVFILQEWAGYLLTATNDMQRFLCIEGEGGNGKTVFFAGIEAMLGSDNVSHVPIENFGQKFDLGSTLGKAANICGDVGEIDQVAEGTLKQFTGGDSMFFDRKGIAPISARPTAKLMCAWNNRPRMRDRSSGIWRRMLLVPFLHTISKSERVTGMDTREFWVRSGEVPGILNWAIEGLFRLRKNQAFTESQVCREALWGFRSESNPAGEFLIDHIETTCATRILHSHEIYSAYEKWCRNFGRYPLADRQFFKELNKLFPKIAKKRSSAPGRPWGYVGIKFSDAEIFGEQTPQTSLLLDLQES